MNYVATIGFFDGVHAGHRFLIQQVRDQAARLGLQSAIITFRDHPRAILEGQSPLLLTTYRERIELLKATGINEIFCFDFSLVQQMTAGEFMQLLYTHCAVDVLLMGYDHHFGSDGLKSIADYQRLGQTCGVDVVPVAQSPDGAMSSSKIRRALAAGEVELAQQMLGYPYQLSGQVVHGNHIGHRLGFPTANIQVDACKQLPLAGVYAVKVQGSDLGEVSAIANVGNNPTVGNDVTSIEVHIPGYEGNLYDVPLTVSLIRFIRPEKKFATLDELKRQIEADLISLQSIQN